MEEEYTEEQLLKFREIVRAHSGFYKKYYHNEYYRKNRERMLEQCKANSKKKKLNKNIVKD